MKVPFISRREQRSAVWEPGLPRGFVGYGRELLLEGSLLVVFYGDCFMDFCVKDLGEVA